MLSNIQTLVRISSSCSRLIHSSVVAYCLVLPVLCFSVAVCQTQVRPLGLKATRNCAVADSAGLVKPVGGATAWAWPQPIGQRLCMLSLRHIKPKSQFSLEVL